MPMMPKIIQKGVDKVGKVASSLTGGKKTPEQPTTALNKAQERVNKMITTLGQIDFEGGKLTEEELERGDFENARDALIHEMMDPTITMDDMTRIDNLLQFACDSFADAVREGRYNVAEWSCIALSIGLRDMRRDISEADAEDEEKRKKQIQARTDWFENYRTIINAYKQYDVLQKELADQRAMRDKRKAEYDASYDEYFQWLETPEGQQADADMTACAGDPTKIVGEKNTEAMNNVMKLISMMDDMKGKLMLVKSLNAKMIASTKLMGTHKVNIDLARQALTNYPGPNDEKLHAKFKQLREQEAKRLQDTFIQVQTEQEELNKYSDMVEAILQSSSAKSVIKESVRFRDELKRERNQEDIRAKQAAQRAEEEKIRNRERTARIQAERVRTRERLTNE